METFLKVAVGEIVAAKPNDDVEFLLGNHVIDIKPKQFSKGSAVRELMTCPPFAGRKPIFIGDDTTDESAFAVLPDFSGVGIRWAGSRRHCLNLCLAPGRSVLADTYARSEDRRMMTDFGLDLAVIGNGRTAALLEPASRLVWWCYPRFDSDPVFCRLLAGDEEKGFSDVVLDGIVNYASEYVRNTAIVTTVLTDSTAQRCGSPISRRASAISTASSGRRSSIRIIEPIAGLAAHHHPRPADPRLRQPDHASVRSAATTSRYLRQATPSSGSPPTRRSPTSSARRPSCSPARSIWCSAPTSRSRATSPPTCREFCRSHARLLDGLGAAAVDRL